MSKRTFCICIALILIITSLLSVNAAFTELSSTVYSEKDDSITESIAEALYEMGLFRGTGNGFELERVLTRAEGITMLVRMLGKETEAASMSEAELPFTDVAPWAHGYISYAFTNGITKGISPVLFGSADEMAEYMFLTLTLRALGYSDSGDNAQFIWNDPFELAYSVGLTSPNENIETATKFTRGDTAEVFWNALEAKLANEDLTLAEYLISNGIFTSDDYENAKEIISKAENAEYTVPTTSETESETVPETETEPDTDVENSLTLIYITERVQNNNIATLKIKGKPNTEYHIEVYYSSGSSNAEGLENKTSDKNGYVTWQWKVGAKTKEGSHRILIFGGGEKLETSFYTYK